MLILFLTFIIDAIIYMVFKNTINHEVLNIISLILYTAVLVNIIKRNSETKYIFVLMVISYILKVGYMFFDIYANGTYLLLKDTLDAQGFHRVALAILDGTENIIGAEKGNYPVLLSFIYRVFGVNRFIAQYLNVLLFSLTQVLFLKIIKILDIENEKAILPVFLICLMPASIIFIPMLMRESILIFLFTITIYSFIRWFKGGAISYGLFPIPVLLMASIMHMGSLILIPVYIFFLVFYNRDRGRFIFRFRSIAYIVLLMGALIAITLIFKDIFLTKLGLIGIDRLEYLYRYLEYTAGDSAYLVDLDYNSIWDVILFSFARIFYFLFSPVPWEWRGLMDATVFFIDAAIYLIFVLSLIPMFLKTKKGDRVLFVAFVIQVFLFILIFANGTYTSGAAIRHRFKGFVLMLTVYLLSGNGDVFGISSWIGKKLKLGKGRLHDIDENKEFNILHFRALAVPLKILEFRLFMLLPDELYIKMRYRIRTRKKLNLENPVLYNEKLQWLKLHDYNSVYPTIVDKISVRDYISDKVGSEHLIPLLGVWDRPEDINYDKLPAEFVLKCNHDSGSTRIIKEKNIINIREINAYYNKKLNLNYYNKTREWPYKNLEHKIICEKYLNDGSALGLRDYKIFCFNGRAEFIRTNYQGKKRTMKSEFDRDWNLIEDTMNFIPDGTYVERPEKLEEMIELAEKLSEGFIHLRVDLYYVDNKIFVGELTLYHGSGMNWFRTVSLERKLGEMIDLNKVIRDDIG